MGTEIEAVGYNMGRWWRIVLLQPQPKGYVTCSKRHFSSQRFSNLKRASSSPDHFVMPQSATYLTERRSDRNDQDTHAWVSAGLLQRTVSQQPWLHEAEEKFATVFTANRSLPQQSHDFFSWGYTETQFQSEQRSCSMSKRPRRVSRPVSRNHLQLRSHPSSLALTSNDAVSVVDERSQRFRSIAAFYH